MGDAPLSLNRHRDRFNCVRGRNPFWPARPASEPNFRRKIPRSLPQAVLKCRLRLVEIVHLRIIGERYVGRSPWIQFPAEHQERFFRIRQIRRERGRIRFVSRIT